MNACRKIAKDGQIQDLRFQHERETDSINVLTYDSAGVWAWLIVCTTLSMRIIVNKMVSCHDRAAECARKSLLTLLEAEIKPLIMALVRIKYGVFI